MLLAHRSCSLLEEELLRAIRPVCPDLARPPLASMTRNREPGAFLPASRPLVRIRSILEKDGVARKADFRTMVFTGTDIEIANLSSETTSLPEEAESTTRGGISK